MLRSGCCFGFSVMVLAIVVLSLMIRVLLWLGFDVDCERRKLNM